MSLQVDIANTESPMTTREAASKHCKTKPTEQKTEGSSDDDLLECIADAEFESTNWKSRYETWHEYLLKGTLGIFDKPIIPTQQQLLIIDAVHNRCVLDHAEERSSQACQTDPFLRLIHGLPGSGKSKVIEWLKQYFQEV